MRILIESIRTVGLMQDNTANLVGNPASKFLLSNDAVEVLLKREYNENLQASGRGVLLLADGGRFEGDLFGASVISEGELVFTTGMTGYQESLTDPSFAGQVLTFTWPLIGNYGIHNYISESVRIHARGVVCHQLIDHPDHRDSVFSVNEFLLGHGIPGISGVDTRTITRRVREYGTLLCAFGPIEMEEELRKRLDVMKPPDLGDLVDEVSISQEILLNPGVVSESGDKLPRIAAIDCGIKYNILRELEKRFEVLWCPPDMSFDSLVDEYNIDALFCSNGPGDPAHKGMASAARETLAKAIESDYPTMGICLGHQLLGLANGMETYKLRYGHRGANQPVIDLKTGKVDITSQNHGFAVSAKGVEPLSAHPSWISQDSPDALFDAATEIRYVNANDRTVEGMDVLGKDAFSIQFHPEACPGPHDAAPLFDRFQKMVEGKLDGMLPLSKRGVA